MGKIFGSDASKAAIYKVSEAKVSIGGGNAVFLNVDITFSRQLQPIATIGSGIQWAAQPPQGTMNVGTILTNDSSVLSALKADGNSCQSTSITINTANAICTSSGSSGGKTITINGAYCSQVQYTLSAQAGYIAQNVAVNFTEMSVS